MTLSPHFWEILLSYFLNMFTIMLPYLLSVAMIVVGVTWAKMNRRNCRSIKKPVILAVFGPIICIVLTILAIHFHTIDWDPFYRTSFFLATIAFGAFAFLLYGVPLLLLIFGLVWLRNLKKRNEPRRKYFMIWILIQIVLTSISVVFFLRTMSFDLFVIH